jgi:methionyl-tRNA synthetase
MYVWLDALNIFCRLRFPDEGGPALALLAGDVHIIGKDIVAPHGILAAFSCRRAALHRRVLRPRVPVSTGARRCPKSADVIDPFTWPDAYGVDQLRYFFLREVPFGQDGNYSHDAIVNRINATLANDLGNLAQRSLSMVARNCGRRLAGKSANSAAVGRGHTGRGASAARKGAVRDAGFRLAYRALIEIWAVVAERTATSQSQAALGTAQDRSGPHGDRAVVTADVLRMIGHQAHPSSRARRAQLLDQLAVATDAASWRTSLRRVWPRG